MNASSNATIYWIKYSSVQFSPLTDWVVRGDMMDDSAEILFQSFLQEQFLHGQGRSFYDVVQLAFPLSTTASPTLQRAMKDAFPVTFSRAEAWDGPLVAMPNGLQE